MTSSAPRDPTLPELSVRAIATVLVYFERRHGRARLEQVWRDADLPLSLEHVTDHSNFVSLWFVERILDVLAAASAEPDFMVKAAMLNASPDALGFAYYLFKAAGSPKLLYPKMVELGPTFNRVGVFTIEELRPDFMRLAYVSRLPESNRNLCIGRMAQFAAMTQIWGLPPADARELQCQVNGADCCRYELQWHRPVRNWRGLAGGMMGFAAATLWPHVGPHWGLTALVTTSAGALGAWLDGRTELRMKDELLASQNEGLSRSMYDLERRYEELHELNVELEGRVAQRTAELSHALTKARELDRLKTEFFDNISHELRTPLSLILLSLESLTGGEASDSLPAMRQHLDTMERSASRLLRLVNQLLDLAKLESGKLRLRYEPVDLHALLSSLLLPFHQLAQKRQVALSLEGAASEPVQADAERIDVVFQNLLSNALKFSRPGGAVKVVLREVPDAVEVEVADDGVGIPAADLPVIFDRFAQADSQGIKRFGGTGIGLAVVRETLEAHGGSIRVSSELKVGTTFTVQLPRGRAHIREELRERRSADLPVAQDRRGAAEPLADVQPRQTAGPYAGPEGLPTTPADAPRILVVEDDPDLRRVIAAALRTRYRVLEASDGVEGLERVTSELPDLVVTDLMMPRRSGLQLVRDLRANPATADLPAVLLTARRETESLVEALGGGANDFLAKPFASRELLARVAVQLRLREAAVRSAAAERLSALGLLTSGFAHEVRNPLNGLLNAVEPLRASVRAGTARDAEMLLDVMRDCGERIQKLAEALLGFARPGALDAAVDVVATLESTLSVLSWRLSPAVKMVRELSANPPVRGDASALGQVWLNLLDNALRAIGREGEIAVRTRVEQGVVCVSISDSGPGMADSVQAKLFQPFFSTRPAGEGTGLGLALSRRIVLAHGGRIGVKSAPGQGTTFTVELPLAGAERATGT